MRRKTAAGCSGTLRRSTLVELNSQLTHGQMFSNFSYTILASSLPYDSMTSQQRHRCRGLLNGVEATMSYSRRIGRGRKKPRNPSIS